MRSAVRAKTSIASPSLSPAFGKNSEEIQDSHGPRRQNARRMIMMMISKKSRRATGHAAPIGREANAAPDGPELPTDKAFVLQFARDTQASLDAFAGRLEHLASGRRVRFGTFEEFLGAVGRLLGKRE